MAIFADILLKAKGGSNKTRIMCGCNLSYKQLELCLKFLMEKNLLIQKVDDNGREEFATTKKGKDFVRKFFVLQSLLQ